MEPKQISYDQKLHQLFIAQESDTQIFYTIDNTRYHHNQCRVKELLGRRVRACFHGWVVLSNHPDSVLWSLWNPLTSKLIRLPPLIYKENVSYECCLSSPPDDKGSVLLLTSSKVPTIVFCRLDRKRKRFKWTEMSYAKQLRSITGVDEFDCLLHCPTCCNGKVYAMALGFYRGLCYSSVIQIDIAVKGKEVVISLIEFVDLPFTLKNRCPSVNSFQKICPFLKGFCTDLFYIDVCFKDETKIEDVYLFKLDTTSMIWENMVNLKDAIFFIEFASGYSACFYDLTANSEIGGYVHILGESGKIIYSFHAKDRTVSISSMPCLVRESKPSSWAMLEWRLEVDHVESKQQKEDKDTEIVDKTEFDATSGESHLLNIPTDILVTIMELCVGSEYMRFRATCKHCYLATPPIQWSSKTTLRRLQTYSLVSPLLMVLDNYQGIITFIDPTHDDRYLIKVPQELKGDYQIYCSRYGWLLMCEYNGPMVFFNPFTSIIIKLPGVPYLESFCFSAPPTSPDCMVLGFTKYGQWHLFYHFVSRESIWRTFRLNFGGDDPCSFRFPTFNGRDVYALCKNNELDVFGDLSELEDYYSWELVVEKASISGCKSPAQYFLSSCDQHRLLVVVGEFGESVEVFKANESTEEWEKIDGLGKHMIYISNTSCVCLEAKLPEMENKIYFPRLLHNEGTKVVFYSLETCKYHTFDDKNIQVSFGVDLFETKHHCNPLTWIEPTWS